MTFFLVEETEICSYAINIYVCGYEFEQIVSGLGTDAEKLSSDTSTILSDQTLKISSFDLWGAKH